MKIKMLLFPFALLLLAGCTKAVAVEEEMYDEKLHTQKVGASATDLLTDAQYTRLKIEVQYMEGFAPDSVALQNLRLFLFERLHKPEGIYISTKQISSVADSVLDLQQIAAIEKVNRKTFTAGRTLSVYILYTNGYYQQEKMLGYAYRNTSAVLFGKNIKESTNSPKKLSRTHLETIVLQHEIGHLLGLVNIGTPLQSDHKDDKNGKHCKNKICLMYHMADTDESRNLIVKKQLPRLDEACLADLRAAGGK